MIAIRLDQTKRRLVVPTTLVALAIAALLYWFWPRATSVEAFDYIAEKATALGNDPARIERFVAEEIKAETYSGVLRGALGTLWSGAGNDLDRSLLRQALLGRAKAPNLKPADKIADAEYHRVALTLITDGPSGVPMREPAGQIRVADVVGRDLQMGYRLQSGKSVAVLLLPGVGEFVSKVDAATAKRQQLLFTVIAPDGGQGGDRIERARELFSAQFEGYPNQFDIANRYIVTISAGWIPASVLTRETELTKGWSDRIAAVGRLTAYAFLTQSDRHAQALARDKGIEARFASPRLTIFGAEAEREGDKTRFSTSLDLRLNDIAVNAPDDMRAAFQTVRSRYDAALESTVLAAMTGDQAYSASDVLADGFLRQPANLVQRQFLLNVSLGRLLYEAKQGSALAIAPRDIPDLRLGARVVDKDTLELTFSDKLKAAMSAAKVSDLGILNKQRFGRADLDRVTQELEVLFALSGKLPLRYVLDIEYVDAPASEWYRGARLFYFDDDRRLVFERQYIAFEPNLRIDTLDYYDDPAKVFYDRPRGYSVEVPPEDIDRSRIITAWYWQDGANRGSTPEFLGREAFRELKSTGTTVVRVRQGDRSDTQPIRLWVYNRHRSVLTVNNRRIEVPVITVAGALDAPGITKPETLGKVPELRDPVGGAPLNVFTVLDDDRYPLFNFLGATVQTAIPGRVTDKESGAGVPMARVRIVEPDLATLSWPDGRFSLPLIKEPFKEFTVEVEAPGYRPYRVKVDFGVSDSLPLKLALEPAPEAGGFDTIDRSNVAVALPATRFGARSKALIAEAISANGNLSVAVPRFALYSPYGATEAWIEFDTKQMTEYPRMVDGLYGSTSRRTSGWIDGVADAWDLYGVDVKKWAGDKALDKVRKLPSAVVSYYLGRIASWYLFAAGTLDSVGMAIEQGGATLEAMYKNAVKKAYEYAKMYDKGYLFGKALDAGVGGNYGAFQKGLTDGLAWAGELYRKAWGL